MRKVYTAGLGLILACHMWAFPALANTKAARYIPVVGAQLKQHNSGSTHIGEYSSKTPRSTSYDYIEIQGKDGTTFYKEGTFSVKGVWYIKDDRFICYVYSEPQGLTSPQCFAIFELDGCYYSYSEFNVGANGRPKNFDNWGSRHIVKGTDAVCAQGVG